MNVRFFFSFLVALPLNGFKDFIFCVRPLFMYITLGREFCIAAELKIVSIEMKIHIIDDLRSISSRVEAIEAGLSQVGRTS